MEGDTKALDEFTIRSDFSKKSAHRPHRSRNEIGGDPNVSGNRQDAHVGRIEKGLCLDFKAIAKENGQ